MLLGASLAFGLAPAQSASDYWSRATADYDADRYEAAARGFEHVAALSPRSGLAWAMLGLCEYQLRRFDAALKHLELAHRLGLQQDARIRHVAFYHEGLLLIEAGRFEDAQKTLDALAVEGVDSPELKDALGRAVLRSRRESPATAQAGKAEWLAAAQRPDAADAYARIVKQFGSEPNVHYAYGRYLLGAHRNQEAMEAFREELRVNPKHVLARLALADTLRSSDLPAALSYARGAVRLAPEVPLAHYLLGMCLLDSHQPREAAAELEIAGQKLPDEPRIYYALARAYSLLGRRGEARSASDKYKQLTGK